MDQHRLARHRPCGEHREVGGERRDADAGALDERHVVRNGNGAVGRQAHVFRRRAGAGVSAVHEHPLPDVRRRNAMADGGDGARAVAVRDDPAGR